MSTAILDNEVLLGILFNGTMEINISVIALFVLYQSTKNLEDYKTFLHLTLHSENLPISGPDPEHSNTGGGGGGGA